MLVILKFVTSAPSPAFRLMTRPDVVWLFTVVVAFVTDGVSATGFTVNMKVFTSGPPTDRLIVTVILVVPLAFVAGLIVTTPVEPVIATLRCAASFGTSVALLDVAVTE